MWTLSQALFGVSHGWYGALAGSFLNTWHCEHCQIRCSISVLIFGHHMCIHATDFVFTIPACVSCSSAIMVSLNLVGMTTCNPLRMQPERMVNWNLFGKYGCNIFGMFLLRAGQPLLIYSHTFERTSSSAVAFAMSCDLIGSFSNWLVWMRFIYWF